MFGMSVGSVSESAEEVRGDVRAMLVEQLRVGRFEPVSNSWMVSADPDFSRMLGARGFIGLTIPTEYGGQGRSAMDRFVVNEELLAAGAPIAAHWIADRQMVPSILRHGTEAQKRRYLPGIAAGETYFAIGMSEPDSGSDLASVRTRAEPTAGGWRINGTKLWTSGAHFADAMVVLARTEKLGENRHAGLSQFIVDLPNPGITIRPVLSLDGSHHFNEVVFEDAVLPPSALLGELGAGWRQVTSELSFERSGPERLLSTMPLLSEWARRVGSTGADTVDEEALGRLTTGLWTLRQMSLAVAEALARGDDPAVPAALVKDLGTRFEGTVVETIRECVQRSAEREPQRPSTPAEPDRLTRMVDAAVLQAPGFTLRGGTNEILRGVIARELAKS